MNSHKWKEMNMQGKKFSHKNLRTESIFKKKSNQGIRLLKKNSTNFLSIGSHKFKTIQLSNVVLTS